MISPDSKATSPFSAAANSSSIIPAALSAPHPALPPSPRPQSNLISPHAKSSTTTLTKMTMTKIRTKTKRTTKTAARNPPRTTGSAARHPSSPSSANPNPLPRHPFLLSRQWMTAYTSSKAAHRTHAAVYKQKRKPSVPAACLASSCSSQC